MSMYKKQVERVVSPEDYANPTKIPKGLMGFGSNPTATGASTTIEVKHKHELAVPEFAVTQTKYTQPFDQANKGVEIFSQTIQNLKNGRRNLLF